MKILTTMILIKIINECKRSQIERSSGIPVSGQIYYNTTGKSFMFIIQEWICAVPIGGMTGDSILIVKSQAR